jgi:hypothetical protein
MKAWFTSAKGAFRLHNIAIEESRFNNCLHATPEATVSLIADLVEADKLLTKLPADKHPAVRAALQPAASRGPEAVRAPC